MYKTASRFMQRSGQPRTATGILGHEGQRFLEEVIRKLAAETPNTDCKGNETAMSIALRRAGIDH